MATSGTYNFTLDLGEIIEESYERCGLESRVSYDLVTARRSLDLLLQEWANSQVNLWTMDLTDQALTASTNTYTLAHPILGVLDGVCRDSSSSTDIPMERISMEEYLNRPTKDTTGRPVQFAVERKENDLTLYIWPTPDVSTYTFRYYALKHIQDTGRPYSNNVEIPRRFLPALTAGLAYKLSQKNPSRLRENPDGSVTQVGGVSQQLRQELLRDYNQAFMLAKDEDRERASFIISPNYRYY